MRRAAVQGDMVTALAELHALPPDTIARNAAETRACILARFGDDDATQPPSDLPAPVAEIALAYQRYWKTLMLKRAAVPGAEAALWKDLNAALARASQTDVHTKSLEETMDSLPPLLNGLGFHSLFGMTTPYYELMLWRGESTERFAVSLPESMATVEVVFMSDFSLRGWLGFATCDSSTTGGWATRERLFTASDSYDRSTENFQVSYLVHEGQHFADYERHPRLEQPELEYRAKLAELAQSSTTTRSLLLRFSRGAAAGRGAPHAHAEYWLARRMSEKLLGRDEISRDADQWQRVGDADIRRAAREMLIDSSTAADAIDVTGKRRFLPN